MAEPGRSDVQDCRQPDLRVALGAALREALGARDQVTAAAVRSALAAIGNAEAVSGAAPQARGASPHVAGASAGPGSTEVPRRVLAAADIRGIVVAEITERRQAARQYRNAGHHTHAARLAAEADALEAVLGAGPQT